MEISLLGVVAFIFTITALGSVFNHRFLKWPNTIAVMFFATMLALILFTLKKNGFIYVGGIDRLVARMHFDQLLLHWMLPVLLFAGALHVSISDLKEFKFQIFSFATIAVVLSATFIALAISSMASFFHYDITFLQALVFGVLISSTDPVCVLGILNKGNVSKALKAKITGESLFNDGTAVVLFLTLLTVAFGENAATNGVSELDYLLIFKHFLYESIGGTALGFVTAYLASHLTRMVDAYDVEIMITLALAFGTYALAETFNVSAPIAVVIAGLYIGNKTIKKFMSDSCRQNVINFWHLIDEVVNAVLFVLMGLVLVLFNLDFYSILFSVLVIVIMLIARYLSILGAATTLIPLKLLKFIPAVDFKRTPFLMTWCGLRGGISIALALAIPNTHPEVRELFLTMTFVCVFFSVIVQGLSLPKFLDFIAAHEIDRKNGNHH